MGRRPLGIAFRDRSLITKRATKWEGGWQLKFYPNKMGDGKSFSHAERGNTKRFAVVLTRDPRSFIHAVGGRKMFPLVERGHKKVLPFLKGPCCKFRTLDSPILYSPPLPGRYDWSFNF